MDTYREITKYTQLTAGTLVLLLGLVVAMGWYFNIPQLVYFHSSFGVMPQVSAWGFIIAGLALLFIRNKQLCMIFSLMLLGIGFLTLLEYFLNIDLQLNQVFTQDYLSQSLDNSVKMTSIGVLCFLLTGISLFLTTIQKHKVLMESILVILAFVVLVIGFISLLRAVFGVSEQFGVGGLITTSMHTAAGFILLSLGIIAYGMRNYRITGISIFAPLPIFVLVVGITGSNLLLQYLVLSEESTVEGRVELTQNYAENHFVHVINEQEKVLYEVRFDLSHDKGMIISNEISENVKENYPDVSGLGLISSNGDVEWSIPVQSDEGKQFLTNFLKNSDIELSQSVIKTIPYVSDDNGTGFIMILPYHEEGRALGAIFTSYSSEKLFEVYSDSGAFKNYGISLHENGLKIFQTSEIQSWAAHMQRWVKSSTVYLANSKWVIKVWPQDILIRQIYSIRPYQIFVLCVVISVMFSITIQLTISLRVANRLARSSSDAKSNFLSSMSHELRTPMNSIIGYAQLIQVDPSISDKISRNAKNIRSAGNHLLSLINDVIDLSKIESGKIQLSLDSLELKGVVDECEMLSHNLADKFDVTLHLNVYQKNLVVKADYFRLKQVLLNLISNAIKYNVPGGKVELITEYDKNAHKIKIGIKDSGVGLDDNQLKMLFQPFQRLGAERSTIQGTGIGLIISKELVERMNGVIEVESTKGSGSIFWVTLEEGNKNEVSKLGKNEHKIISSLNKQLANKYKILIAEDNPANQELVGQQLQFLGFKFDTVSDGKEAYDAWIKSDYDVILLDINMPGMNGYDVTERIRRDEKERKMHTPIIAFTANALKEDITRCLESGMDDYLVKPVEIESLQEKLLKFLPDLADSVTDKNYNNRLNCGAETDIKTQRNQKENMHTSDILDTNAICQYVGNNVTAQIKIYEKYIDSAPDIHSQLLSALDEKNADEVRAHAHKLKSSSKAVGANELSALSLKMEEAAKENNMESVEEKRKVFETLVSDTLTLIKHHIREIKSNE